MSNHRFIRATVRWLVFWSLALLCAGGLADGLVRIVVTFSPGYLGRMYAVSPWLAHLTFQAYIYEALAFGLLGGFLCFWRLWDRVAVRPLDRGLCDF